MENITTIIIIISNLQVYISNLNKIKNFQTYKCNIYVCMCVCIYNYTSVSDAGQPRLPT